HSNMGVAYVRQGRYNEAASAFARAAELEPTNVLFLVGLGDALKLAGRKKEAQEAYGRAEALGGKVMENEKGKENGKDKGKKK
ncbi:MAG: tetratricopeptide repeat protein, partial [Acidobacteria bacterium]|nr:tetratricopeptide repeat protein [Acidobacteriota bacterium]